MSRTLTISEELYTRLEAEARARGLSRVEQLIETWERMEAEFAQRQSAVRRVDDVRERLSTKHGEMPDSTELVREDRAP